MLNADAWYAVWTRSHCERIVAGQLAARGFSPFLPEAPTPVSRGRATRLVHAPIFPGYLFVRDAMSKHRYIDLLQVRGIVRVLEDGWARLTPVPDADIDAIRRIVDAGVRVFAFDPLREGERVRVTNGPLRGIEGRYVRERHDKGRLVVSVTLLGRTVAVDMHPVDVTRCH